MSYVSLHNHSHFSTGFDGYQTIKEMVSRGKELGYPAIALTDHGTMAGCYDFYKECKESGIKPILGMEAYFTPDHTVKDRKLTHHLVLLAMNNEGYSNLKKMDSIAYGEDYFYFKPRIDWEVLQKHSEGIICLSACMASIVNTDVGEEWFQKYKSLFGDRFYAEIQPLDIDIQREYNRKVMILAEKYNVPLVVTTDAHFARKEDAPYHKLWIGITKKDYYDNDNYLWAEGDFHGIPQEAIDNTGILAERCSVSLEMEGNHYPVYPVEDKEKAIRDICRDNWKELVPAGKYKEYAERFELEMKTLKQVDYFNYLLIIWDMLNHCRSVDIPVGVGRGSVGGSLVCFLMKIHALDPIKHGLKFFRFVNPYRVSPCDIDTDVSTLRRGEVIDYIKKKYGNVSKIFTQNYLSDKSAIQRAGQALRMEPSLIDDITKQVSCIDDVKNEKLRDVAKHFYGRLEKFGVHASAILITPDDVTNYCPLEGAYSTDAGTGKRVWTRVAAYDWHKLEEDFGLLKLDILGLSTLVPVDETMKAVGISSIPSNDEATISMYARGALTGVFQMESKGMQGVAKEMQVSSFEDIAALVALFRPGPLDSGMLQQYLDGKHGESVKYPCEAMEKITSNTYGVLVYQEQIMLIAMLMAGYNLGEADALRKVIGRKELDKIEEATNTFIGRCVKKGYSRDVAREVAKQIEAAGRYVFNRCVSGREYIFKPGNGTSIGEMYKIRNDEEYAREAGRIQLHEKYKKNGFGVGYSMNEKGISMNRIVNIFYSGEMPVYIVETETGKTVLCTMNHKFPTPEGQKLLQDLAVGDEVYVDGRDNSFYRVRAIMEEMSEPCSVCGKPYDEEFELHYADIKRRSNFVQDLLWLCSRCHKKVHCRNEEWVPTEKIKSISFDRVEDCYDVEMEAPAHNFVTGNGIVVCNSHAVEYGYLSYITAYLKCHYPLQYMCSLINSKNDHDSIVPYIEECRRMGIKILPPDYHQKNEKWEIRGDSLLVGLTYVKGVGKNLVLQDVESWSDIVSTNNKRVNEGLIKAGAYDFIGKSRGWMLSNLEDTQKTLQRKRQCLDKIREYEEKGNERMLMQWKEKLSAAEFTETAEESYNETAGEIEVLSFSFREIPRIVQGQAVSVHEFKDKKGRTMARVSFRTEYGDMQGIIFASAWKKKSGITIEQGKDYEVMIEKGIVKDAKSCIH